MSFGCCLAGAWLALDHHRTHTDFHMMDPSFFVQSSGRLCLAERANHFHGVGSPRYRWQSRLSRHLQRLRRSCPGRDYLTTETDMTRIACHLDTAEALQDMSSRQYIAAETGQPAVVLQIWKAAVHHNPRVDAIA